MKENNKSLNILNLDKLVDFITRFVELKLELYELKVKQQLVVIISSFATLALIISFGLFMIFFGSLALGCKQPAAGSARGSGSVGHVVSDSIVRECG